MKKLAVFVFLNVTTFLSAQSYGFDFLAKYSFQNNLMQTEDSVWYFNSDDFSYYLKLIKLEDGMTSTLFDIRNDLAHRFKVIESNNKDDIQFSFIYEYSYSIKKRPKSKERAEFTDVSASPKQVLMKIYRKKTKKPACEHLLKLVPANKNLFPMYAISHSDSLQPAESLHYSGNFIVTKDQISEGKTSCALILSEHKNVDLTIKLPTPLVY